MTLAEVSLRRKSTLQGTNILYTLLFVTFEDDFPFPKVGYVDMLVPLRVSQQVAVKKHTPWCTRWWLNHLKKTCSLKRESFPNVSGCTSTKHLIATPFHLNKFSRPMKITGVSRVSSYWSLSISTSLNSNSLQHLNKKTYANICGPKKTKRWALQ